MILNRITSKARERYWSVGVIGVLGIGAWLIAISRPLIGDIAWLLEASRRWVSGDQLYTDIIEVNPPLVFYETVGLSGGLLTPQTYMAGVCLAMVASALWIRRLYGDYLAFASFAAMLFAGFPDIGQRDHLALIFLIPFLFANRAGTKERLWLGIWAFLGVGLKPHLLLVPLIASLARSRKPPELISLGLCCILYVVIAYVRHPAYFRETVPLGQFVYGTYGVEPTLYQFIISAVLIVVAAVTLAQKDRDKFPLALAVLAALASFYLQNRFSYHIVPALGFGILLALWLRTLPALVLSALLSAAQISIGMPRPERPTMIPAGVHTVAVLGARVSHAYPSTFNCGVTNATRYPALWTLPGAWNIARNPIETAARKQRALSVLDSQRTTIREDILKAQPQIIYADASKRKYFFESSFDYMNFLGPFPGYMRIGSVGIFDVWVSPKFRVPPPWKPCAPR